MFSRFFVLAAIILSVSARYVSIEPEYLKVQRNAAFDSKDPVGGPRDPIIFPGRGVLPARPHDPVVVPGNAPPPRFDHKVPYIGDPLPNDPVVVRGNSKAPPPVDSSSGDFNSDALYINYRAPPPDPITFPGIGVLPYPFHRGPYMGDPLGPHDPEVVHGKSKAPPSPNHSGYSFDDPVAVDSAVFHVNHYKTPEQVNVNLPDPFGPHDPVVVPGKAPPAPFNPRAPTIDDPFGPHDPVVVPAPEATPFEAYGEDGRKEVHDNWYQSDRD